MHGAVPRAARPGVLTRHDRPEKPVKQVRLGATGCDSRLPFGHFCFLLSQFLLCLAAMSKNPRPAHARRPKFSLRFRFFAFRFCFDHSSFCILHSSFPPDFTPIWKKVSLPSNENAIFISKCADFHDLRPRPSNFSISAFQFSAFVFGSFCFLLSPFLLLLNVRVTKTAFCCPPGHFFSKSPQKCH